MKKIFLLIVLPLVIVLFNGCKEDSVSLDDYTESKHYVNVSSTNSEQCEPCINSPLYIDTRLLWKQAIGSNCS